MVFTVARIARFLIVAALAAAVAACTFTKFAYNQADTVMAWLADDYFDLDLTFSQEIPGPGRWIGRWDDSIRLFATFDNFLNFLNDSWNIQRRRNFSGFQDIAGLRRMFATFEGDKLHAKLDDYSEVNIAFHQSIIELSGNQALIRLAENLFTHMRMIRGATIGEDDRVDRSIRDHMNIIRALEARDTERAEDLVRQHALGLAEHVAKHADYLD